MSILLSDTQAGVRTLTLNRPEKLNAFNAALHAALRDALHEAADDEDVKAVVITGAGRAFSSGQDLTEDLPRSADGRIDLKPPLERDYNPLALMLAAYPKPLIAALNGPAVGAAMNLALACDIVIAAQSATLQQAFVRIGLIPDAGGTWLLPRLIGSRRALALMMTGEAVDARRAFDLGLVHKVVDDAALAEETQALAGSMARGPGLAYRLMREAVSASATNTLQEQLQLEARLQCEAGRSDDFMEGVAAFREKRAPRFTGR